MTTEISATATASTLLVHGQFLTGKITKPYIKDNKLLGAILSFEGRSETALLHRRQMTGENPAQRLAELGLGDPLLVRMVIVNEAGRKVQATEKGVEYSHLLDQFEGDREKFRGIEGRVHSLTDFGTFVELLDTPTKGHRGLLRAGNLSASGRPKLGSFVSYSPGDLIFIDLAEARVDDSGKLLLRLENARPRVAAAA